MRNLAFYGPFLPTSGPTPMSAKRWKMYPHNALTPLAVRNFSASFWRFTRPNVPLRGEIKCRKLNFSWVQISSFEIFYRHNPSQKPPRANKKNFKWFEAIFLLNFNEMSDPLFSEFAPQFKMASIMWNSSILVIVIVIIFLLRSLVESEFYQHVLERLEARCFSASAIFSKKLDLFNWICFD